MRLREIFEARDATKTYTNKEIKGKIERVTVKLEGTESATFTKLAKRYKELDVELSALEIKKNALNAETKEKVLELYDAEDEIYTRVVETVSMTATMSKLAQPDPKVDHEAVLAKLIELMPELTEKVKELTKEFSSTPKPKSPSLTVKTNEGVADAWNSLKEKFKKFYSGIVSWGKSYDSKLAKIKSMLHPLTEAKEEKVYVTLEHVKALTPAELKEIEAHLKLFGEILKSSTSKTETSFTVKLKAGKKAREVVDFDEIKVGLEDITPPRVWVSVSTRKP